MAKRAYAVMFAPAADRELRRLPEAVQRRIIAAVETLQENPRPVGTKKLAGTEDLWRVRVGEYRVVYQIDDDRLLVLVVRVAHRKDVYRG